MVLNISIFLKKLLSTPTGRNSLIMFAGSIITGGLNYLFHPIISHFLGKEKYGEVASLLSIFTISAVSIIALSTVIVKYTSTFKGEGDFGSIRFLFTKLTKNLTILGLVFFIVISIFSSSVSSFLRIDSPYPVIFLGLLIFFAFLFYINLGILQGLLDFFFYSLINVVVATLRIALPLLAVLLSFSVSGVIAAVAISLLIGYLLSFLPLKFLFKEKSVKQFTWKPLVKYTLPTLVAVLGQALLSSVDIILVKHFFDPVLAGVYAAGSTLGKIILFTTTPIAQVMFPLISERHAGKKKYSHLLFYALALVALTSVFITLIYFLFPGLVVGIMFPRFPETTIYLGLFGIALSFYSLANVLINFFLSVHKTEIAYGTLIAGGLLSLLLWFYHQSLFQVLFVSIGVNALLLAYLVLYFLLNYAKKST